MGVVREVTEGGNVLSDGSLIDMAFWTLGGAGVRVDYQVLFNIVGGAALVGIGWFGDAMWKAVHELRADFADHRAELPRIYVAKDDYKTDIGRVHELLDKIYDKIDGKADR